MSNVETWDNKIEALYDWIDYSNLNRVGSATTTPISKLSDLYVLRSNLILSNRTAVLEHNDYIQTVNNADTLCLKYSHLRSSTVEGPQLDNNTCWIMTRQELIDFLDSGETTETQLENNTNHIATTGVVLNWITLNRCEVSSKSD